jgi:hypothetical protein
MIFFSFFFFVPILTFLLVCLGQDLSVQREVIEGMQGRLGDINEDIDRSNSLMQEMYRRMRVHDFTFPRSSLSLSVSFSLSKLFFFFFSLTKLRLVLVRQL